MFIAIAHSKCQVYPLFSNIDYYNKILLDSGRRSLGIGFVVCSWEALWLAKRLAYKRCPKRLHIFLWAPRFIRKSVHFEWLINLLLRSFRHLYILKSAPFHPPKINAKKQALYFGDGLGCLDTKGEIPWITTSSSRSKDSCHSCLLPIHKTCSIILNEEVRDDSFSVIINRHLTEALERTLLLATPESKHIQAKKFLEGCSSIVYLSTLYPHRTSHKDQISLILEYLLTLPEFSNNESKSKIIAIIPHPQHFQSRKCRSFLDDLKFQVRLFSRTVYVMEFSHPISMLNCEQLYLLNEYYNYHCSFHVFASSALFLHALSKNTRFYHGYGTSLIHKYFHKPAVKSQITLENLIKGLMDSANITAQ